MPIQKGADAVLRGRAGAKKRWAHATPEDRAKQSALMQAGIHNKYIVQARALAVMQGTNPTEGQIGESAALLWEADLAHRRWLAWKALQNKPAKVVVGGSVGVEKATTNSDAEDFALDMSLVMSVDSDADRPATDRDLRVLDATLILEGFDTELTHEEIVLTDAERALIDSKFDVVREYLRSREGTAF